MHLDVTYTEAPLWSLYTGFSFMWLTDEDARYVYWDFASFSWNVFFQYTLLIYTSSYKLTEPHTTLAWSVP